MCQICGKDTHASLCCQEENLRFKNHNVGLPTHLLVCTLILRWSTVLFRLNTSPSSKKEVRRNRQCSLQK